MPRQIIDTESSRPRYVRRRVLTAVLVVVVVVLIAALLYVGIGHFSHTALPGK